MQIPGSGGRGRWGPEHRRTEKFDDTYWERGHDGHTEPLAWGGVGNGDRSEGSCSPWHDGEWGKDKEHIKSTKYVVGVAHRAPNLKALRFRVCREPTEQRDGNAMHEKLVPVREGAEERRELLRYAVYLAYRSTYTSLDSFILNIMKCTL